MTTAAFWATRNSLFCLDPAGVLAETALWTRVAAAAIGFVVYRVFSNNVLAGVVAAEVAIVIALVFR